MKGMGFYKKKGSGMEKCETSSYDMIVLIQDLIIFINYLYSLLPDNDIHDVIVSQYLSFMNTIRMKLCMVYQSSSCWEKETINKYLCVIVILTRQSFLENLSFLVLSGVEGLLCSQFLFCHLFIVSYTTYIYYIQPWLIAIIFNRQCLKYI